MPSSEFLKPHDIPFEAPRKNSWITSGRWGSRDAVLVFRTNVWSDENKQILCDDHATNESGVYFFQETEVHESDSRTNQNLNPVQSSFGSLNSLAKLSNSDVSLLSDADDKNDGELNLSNSLIGDTSMQENIKPRLIEFKVPRDMPAATLEIKYKFQQTETKLLRVIFTMHGLSEADGEESFSILWTGVHMKPDVYRNLAPYQRVNHFPRSYELTRKDRLYKNIVKMQHLRGMKHFDIVPQSFILPLEHRDLLTAHKKYRGPWIVKPAASSRGRGIFIVSNPEQINQDEQVLVSKYIAHPLCIDGHKCDVRIYVLVTSFDPLIIYLYEEGLVRIATVKYERNVDNLWNPCMHLCNYSINKYHSDYIKSSDAQEEDVGHKWTLSALLRHLKQQGCNIDLLMLNIEDLVIKSILSCSQSIISACRMFVPSGNNCFELYGFDILIDDSLKPWLLEINLSPSMGVDSPLDTKVKASMITDLLTCIGIPAYSSHLRYNYDTKWTRFRNLNSGVRRTGSLDPTLTPTPNSSSKTINSKSHQSTKDRHVITPLSLEEIKIIRNARMQNARSGGFVRIFPTEDSMQRYGSFLDTATGIPVSTPIIQGQSYASVATQHNFNLLLFNHLYGKDSLDGGVAENNTLKERMVHYERALNTSFPIVFKRRLMVIKCEEEGKRLRKQVLKLIDNGSEFTQFQARRAFASYMSAILNRLTQEPRDHHEKILLRFLERISGSYKMPLLMKNAITLRGTSKAKSAMVAKLLRDFIDQYTKDTDAYVDSFGYFGMIPKDLFNEFLSNASEADLESVLTLHTNVTGNMPYLYNRYGVSVPATPPIPSGLHGFLRALPAMVSGPNPCRESNKFDAYIKHNENRMAEILNRGRNIK